MGSNKGDAYDSGYSEAMDYNKEMADHEKDASLSDIEKAAEAENTHVMERLNQEEPDDQNEFLRGFGDGLKEGEY